jgi:hypothetical protein
VAQFAGSALGFVVKDPKVQHSLTQVIIDTQGVRDQDAYEELDKLLEDEARHPITYNHYYTDNIQKTRLDRLSKHLEDYVGNAIQRLESSKDVHRLLSSIQDCANIDMTEQACVDARTDLAAYYKVRSSVLPSL